MATTRMHEGALQVLREAGISADLWARVNFQADEECPCLPEQIQEKFAWEYADRDGDMMTIGRNGDDSVLVQTPECGVAVRRTDLAAVFRAMCAKAGIPLQAVLAELAAGEQSSGEAGRG